MPEFKTKEEYEKWKAQRIKENKTKERTNVQEGEHTEESIKGVKVNEAIDYSVKIKLSKSTLLKKSFNNIAPILIIVAIPVLVIIFSISLYGLNYFQLQSKMNNVIKSDSRNQGVRVSVHYANYINPSVLIYDLSSINNSNSKLDVFRVFLQFAEKVKEKNFKIVELSFIGKTKFKLNGTYFKKLGQEYTWQNPIYTSRTFPENLMTPDGLNAYPEWSGGIIGVALKQMNDFSDFHDKWYMEDLLKR
jgi:hypothetical protein